MPSPVADTSVSSTQRWHDYVPVLAINQRSCVHGSLYFYL